MKYLIFKLGYISPFTLFAAILMIASGIKSEPVNLSLAALGLGVLVLVFSVFTFPRPGHPLFEALAKDRESKNEKRQAIETPTRANEYAKWVNAHWEEGQALGSSQISPDVTKAEAPELADRHEIELEPDYSGWCRLDPVIGPSDDATSWIGGRPKMPDDIMWPQKNGHHAVFAAQVAIADLPDDIWGGIGPKSGWLLFFMAPYLKGTNVIHIDQLGPERDYPAKNWFMNYLDSGPRHALASCGRYLRSYEPPKWGGNINGTDKQPLGRYDRSSLDVSPQSALKSLDRTAQQLSELGAPPEADLCTLDFLAVEIYSRRPDTLAPEIRTAVEADWRDVAQYEAASMSGPVPSDYPYSELDDAVLLLQLQSSGLIGWGFGDLGRCAFFIKPSDLKAGRWHKAWFDIAN